MPRVHLAHNSKPPKSVREAPHSKFVCSLYIGKIGHTYLSIPFNIGRWSRVGDHFRHQIVRLVFARRSLLPSKTLLRCGCLSHLMMAQKETYKVKLTELQAKFAYMLSRGHKAPFKWPSSLQTELANSFSLQA